MPYEGYAYGKTGIIDKSKSPKSVTQQKKSEDIVGDTNSTNQRTSMATGTVNEDYTYRDNQGINYGQGKINDVVSTSSGSSDSKTIAKDQNFTGIETGYNKAQFRDVRSDPEYRKAVLNKALSDTMRINIAAQLGVSPDQIAGDTGADAYIAERNKIYTEYNQLAAQDNAYAKIASAGGQHDSSTIQHEKHQSMGRDAALGLQETQRRNNELANEIGATFVTSGGDHPKYGPTLNVRSDKENVYISVPHESDKEATEYYNSIKHKLRAVTVNGVIDPNVAMLPTDIDIPAKLRRILVSKRVNKFDREKSINEKRIGVTE